MNEEKKNAVIEAAQALFARFGYNKTTVDDIARKSCVAKSTIYTHYRSKEEIFDDVIEKEGSFLRHEIGKALSGVSDPVEKMRLYIITRTQHIRKLVNFYRALTDEYLDRYSFIENARRKSIEIEIDIVKSILKEGIGKGVFVIENLDLSAFAVVTAMKGWDFPWTNGVRVPETPEDIEYLVTMLFDGIRKR